MVCNHLLFFYAFQRTAPFLIHHVVTAQGGSSDEGLSKLKYLGRTAGIPKRFQ